MILAIETATANCSVALWAEGTVQARREQQTPQSHARHVLEMVQAVMAEASVTPDQLQALAFGRGPGAFTGLRMAASVIQGLALGWDRPVIGVDTLAVLAWQARQRLGAVPVMALLDARMDEFYVGIYDAAGEVLRAPALIRPDEVAGLVRQFGVETGIGDIAARWPAEAAAFSRWISALPVADGVAALAAMQLDAARPVTEVVPVPLYLRDDVADHSARRGRA